MNLTDENEIADRLHSAAIHLLRKLRAQDDLSRLSAPKLSALSVIVFAAPITIKELAQAEQVSPPTISRMVKELEQEGLVQRKTGQQDKRVQQVEATSKGRQVLQTGRDRRVNVLVSEISDLPQYEKLILSQAVPLIEKLTLPPDHPHHEERPS